MENIIMQQFDTSLQEYETAWIESCNNNIGGRHYNNPTASLYTSMVYSFARHLPYSMDIEQPEYVPADFLNMVPLDADNNPWFKWDDRRTFYNAMINWNDTLKSGILLQICNIFQKMILGQFPTDFELTEENFKTWEIDKLSKDQGYNKNFFEALKSLPNYYHKIIKSNPEERRAILEEMYQSVMTKIEQKLGGFKETDTEGNIIREAKANHNIKPHKDIEMLVYWDNIIYHDGIDIIRKAIKEEQLKFYDKEKISTTVAPKKI